MGITDADRQQAEALMRAETARQPTAVAARDDRRLGRIVVTLNNGVELMFRLALAHGLEHATTAELATIEISPSGLGLHWPSLDADLNVPALLTDALGSRRCMEGRDTPESDRPRRTTMG